MAVTLLAFLSPMSTLNTLSISQLKRAVALKEQIAQLEQELSAIAGGAKPAATPAVAAAKPAPKKGGMSAAGRARIVAAQKARWAKIKAAKGAPAAKPAKKFTMSAAAKAAISRAAKARWAKIKAAKKK